MTDIPKTILLVEDDAITAMCELRLLKDEGFNAIHVDSGEKAVEFVFSGQQTDMILMDIDLGMGMDGTEAAEIILRDYDIPVVFLSSHVEKEIVNKTKKITSYGYILKNSDETVIFASIDMAFKLYEAHIKLKKKQNEFQTLTDNLPDIIVRFDSDLRHIYINRKIESLINIPYSQCIGQTSREMGMSDDLANRWESVLKRVFTTGQSEKTEYSFQSGGDTVYFESVIIPEFDKDGKVETILTMGRNITENKLTENALRESEEIFQLFMQYTPIYVFFKDSNIRAIQLSQNYEKMIGRPMDELLGKNMYELFPSELAKSMVEDDMKILREGKPIEVEEEFDGRLYITTKFPIVRENKPTLLAGFTIDITQLKHVEHNLEKSVKEKEVLLKELQHRVKNNLNIIYSLINLELEKLSDEKSRNVFMDALSRIKAMACVYERLYNSDSIDSIDLQVYIKELTFSLFETYLLDSQNINLITDFEETCLDMKRAIPLALILNELITNALKYAYPNGNKGNICIMLKKNDDEIWLTVSDDGVGFPEALNMDEIDSMGLTLVKMLAEQIEGSIITSSSKNNGASVTIKFKQ